MRAHIFVLVTFTSAIIAADSKKASSHQHALKATTMDPLDDFPIGTIVKVIASGAGKNVQMGDIGTVVGIPKNKKFQATHLRVSYKYGTKYTDVSKITLAGPPVVAEDPVWNFAGIAGNDCNLPAITGIFSGGNSGALKFFGRDFVLKCYPNTNINTGDYGKHPYKQGAVDEQAVMKDTQKYLQAKAGVSQVSPNWVKQQSASLIECPPGDGALKAIMETVGLSDTRVGLWTSTSRNAAAESRVKYGGRPVAGATCVHMDKLVPPEVAFNDNSYADDNEKDQNAKRLIFEAIFGLLVANDLDEFRHCDINAGNMMVAQAAGKATAQQISCYHFDGATIVGDGNAQVPGEGDTWCMKNYKWEFRWMDYDFSKTNGMWDQYHWPKYRACDMNYMDFDADGVFKLEGGSCLSNDGTTSGKNKCNDLHYMLGCFVGTTEFTEGLSKKVQRALEASLFKTVGDADPSPDKLSQAQYNTFLVALLNDAFFHSVLVDVSEADIAKKNEVTHYGLRD